MLKRKGSVEQQDFVSKKHKSAEDHDDAFSSLRCKLPPTVRNNIAEATKLPVVLCDLIADFAACLGDYVDRIPPSSFRYWLIDTLLNAIHYDLSLTSGCVGYFKLLFVCLILELESIGALRVSTTGQCIITKQSLSDATENCWHGEIRKFCLMLRSDQHVDASVTQLHDVVSNFLRRMYGTETLKQQEQQSLDLLCRVVDFIASEVVELAGDNPNNDYKIRAHCAANVLATDVALLSVFPKFGRLLSNTGLWKQFERNPFGLLDAAFL